MNMDDLVDVPVREFVKTVLSKTSCMWQKGFVEKASFVDTRRLKERQLSGLSSLL